MLIIQNNTPKKSIHQKGTHLLCTFFAAAVFSLSSNVDAKNPSTQNMHDIFNRYIHLEVCMTEDMISKTTDLATITYMRKHIRDLHILKNLSNQPEKQNEFESFKSVIEKNRSRIGIRWGDIDGYTCIRTGK